MNVMKNYKTLVQNLEFTKIYQTKKVTSAILFIPAIRRRKEDVPLIVNIWSPDSGRFVEFQDLVFLFQCLHFRFLFKIFKVFRYRPHVSIRQ